MESEAIPASPTVSFSLTTRDAAKALDFYRDALGAEELFRMPTPDGDVGHAEFMIGNTRIFISGESEDWGAFAMPEGTIASCLFAIDTEDCDKAYERSLAAGAESISAPQDYFWGMRSAVIRDPFGYRWSFGQKTEDVGPEEVMRRAEEIFSA